MSVRRLLCRQPLAFRSRWVRLTDTVNSSKMKHEDLMQKSPTYREYIKEGLSRDEAGKSRIINQAGLLVAAATAPLRWLLVSLCPLRLHLCCTPVACRATPP